MITKNIIVQIKSRYHNMKSITVVQRSKSKNVQRNEILNASKPKIKHDENEIENMTLPTSAVVNAYKSLWHMTTYM